MHLEMKLSAEGEWDREGSTFSQTPFYGAPRPMQRVCCRRAGPLSRRSAEKESRASLVAQGRIRLPKPGEAQAPQLKSRSRSPQPERPTQQRRPSTARSRSIIQRKRKSPVAALLVMVTIRRPGWGRPVAPCGGKTPGPSSRDESQVATERGPGPQEVLLGRRVAKSVGWGPSPAIASRVTWI